MNMGIGDRFQEETKYLRGKLSGSLDWSNKPSLYKDYLGSETVELSLPELTAKLSFDEAAKRRRSIRNYSGKPVGIDQLSYLLWMSTGVQRKVRNHEFRTVPSAGALYPIETYIITNNTENLEKGTYHYSIRSHCLERLRLGDFSRKVAVAALAQRMCSEAAVVFIWTAIFARSKWKYNQRAFRYIYLDAGHIAQNLALAATSIGLGSCQIGAFFDDEVNQIIGVDGVQESAIYLSSVGHP